MNEIEIRPLLVEGADAIPKLIEAGIREDIFPLTIFSSDKYNCYIEDRLVHGTDVAFYGAYIKKSSLDTLNGAIKRRICFLIIFIWHIRVEARDLAASCFIMAFVLSQPLIQNAYLWMFLKIMWGQDYGMKEWDSSTSILLSGTWRRTEKVKKNR